MRKILLFLLLSSSFFLMSCQTNMVKEFAKITPGMEKDDVLNKIGSPKESLRLHGRDRWIYVFYEDKIRLEKEVHFYDGTVIYSGDQWQASPENQAEKVDLLHAKQDQELQQRYQQESDIRRQNYYNFVNGPQSQERVKYVPEFTPVQ